ncbi:methylmalonyl-CoA mutase family protein [Mucilaginibacter phyllosphaerae]|uniref:Fused isobutyryl-CoA mutase n=1 Tax=Mucilaginibacter phyllosphaerae TaxID=1812349 RepID=A0A4Y8A9P2_9SPHI|nr:methylmalonyl-CoA mutase family protein [Mucilaginibacter phyllosphaerae]MBB3969799.1 methylmalonyl-CoA mutase [Mucilaginibacter phyllosphaerae]TEW65177.1 methylmalonyl-CoA mutase [Mucilaginibacter phyllosphaerae]
MESIAPYQSKYKIRFVTAASLFDGHDATINIMRRILQSTGAEVIHLGHNRSVDEIVNCAIQEDVQGIALTSYQGGHVEYFKYMHDLLAERGAGHIKIFGGGGGVFLPHEIAELQAYGISKIYSPDDGRTMGLQGMINDMMRQCDFSLTEPELGAGADKVKQIARHISAAEAGSYTALTAPKPPLHIPVLGITGTGGSGKSSLVDEFVRRFLMETDKTLAIISVDPSKRKTGGALLGDRIRMNAINNPRVYMRSLATRQANLALSKHVQEAIDICKAAGYDMVIVETSGIGQSDTMITDYCDLSLYVMTPEFGAATQLEKIDMLDFADLVALNKFDKRGALDAIRDVRKQYKRNHMLFDAKDDDLPVYGTMASQFNDPGMNTLFTALMKTVKEKTGVDLLEGKGERLKVKEGESEKIYIIPPDRVRYLAEIAESSAAYTDWVNGQCKIAQQMYQVSGAMETVEAQYFAPPAMQAADAQEFKTRSIASLQQIYQNLENHLHPDCKRLLKEWPETVAKYKADNFIYKVRDKEIKQPLYYTSLSQLQIPKIALPKYEAWGDILRWLLTENVPGEFPYAAGVFPLKRDGEDPTRMFAGEGGPERTNKRFHYVSLGQPAHRLSTAFDSVTLYGEDPHERPDIYGKIGNSGVSIATLDDAKKLYSGFDLCHASTSVSMTINGPAPMLLGFFMNAAIDQQCEKYITEHGLQHLVEAAYRRVYDDRGLTRPQYQGGSLPNGNSGLGLMLLGLTGDQVLPADVYGQIRAYAIATVRGTVQADILKEDQAQNTCIFSTEFALRMMGDIQQYFIREKVRNFYSVSISGYHIAEAGANPITQLAFTLSNGFTYVEYYLSRGMHIDDFAPNLSFFFSNGIDPEYSVIGRVARRIWAKAIKNKYKGNDRSQKLKYHIQTSGRSLHAQEIDFNDIRTTLQALYAIYDNCNSLHTNAYDEAITTPTEESVRRAMAIQLIINRELGLAKNENPIQGAFIIEELTDLVEQAVLTEFKAINDRGGVLGAMETMYQRSKIQEESLYYETLKHTGEYPIIGVNTFLNKKGSPTIVPSEVIRATEEEKQFQIAALYLFKQRNEDHAPALLKALQEKAIAGDNIFEALMQACKYCSLGQISHALYEVGGQYRRNM